MPELDSDYYDRIVHQLAENAATRIKSGADRDSAIWKTVGEFCSDLFGHPGAANQIVELSNKRVEREILDALLDQMDHGDGLDQSDVAVASAASVVYLDVKERVGEWLVRSEDGQRGTA